MSIKDKLLGDAQEIMDRANKKISQLSDLTSKLLLPGFKQIERDLIDLGVLGFVELSISSGSFRLDSGIDYVYFNCKFSNASYDNGVYIEDAFVFFDTYIQYAKKIDLPRPPSSIEFFDNSIISLDSSNIDDFERYIDDLMGYITRNSQFIIDTIEDVSIFILKESGNIVSY